MIVEGQVHGGVAQGIGNAFYEQLVFDGDGQLLNATLADYLLPTALDVPRMELAHTVTPSPLNPLGIKGVGEAGAIPVGPLFAQALEDALGLPAKGVELLEIPLSPSRLWELAGGGRSRRTPGWEQGSECSTEFGFSQDDGPFHEGNDHGNERLRLSAQRPSGARQARPARAAARRHDVPGDGARRAAVRLPRRAPCCSGRACRRSSRSILSKRGIGMFIPLFYGSSFSYIAAYLGIAQAMGHKVQFGVPAPDEVIALMQAGIICTGFLNIIVGFVIRKLGKAKLDRVLPPVVTGSVACVIGIGLAKAALDMSLTVVPGYWGIALVTLIATVAFSYLLQGKGFIGMLPILLGAIVGYVLTLVVAPDQISFKSVAEAPLFAVPHLTCAELLGSAGLLTAIF